MGRTIQGALNAANIELVQDTVGTMMTNGGGVTWTYNDGAATITPAVDHGGIGGLTDDDHTQYALLAGRAGGQTFTGGTAASDGLTLNTTSNATKGVLAVDTNQIYKTAGGNVGFSTSDVEAWPAGLRAFQLGDVNSFYWENSVSGVYLGDNLYVSGAGNLHRITGPAGRLEIGGGTFSFANAASGTVDTAAALTNRLVVLLGGSTGVGTGSPDRRFHAEEDSAATNTVTYVGRFTSTSTGTPAAGIGAGIEFEVETADGNNEIGATIEAVTTDVTGASEDFALDINVMAAGAAATNVMRFLGTGGLVVNQTNTATVGAVTINKPTGRVNIAAAGTSVVVTNSLVTAASNVFAVAATNDDTARVTAVVAAAGSFTIYTAATTAETAFNFFVLN